MYQLRGSVSVVRGRQSIKAGGEYQVRQVNHTQGGNTGTYNFDQGFTQGPNPLSSSATAGNPFASFLLGMPSGGNLQVPPYVSTQSANWALYLQDDFRVTPRLTLNLGIRWQVEQARTERYNRQNYWDPNVTSPLEAMIGQPVKGGLQFDGVGGNPRAPYQTQWKDIAPRLGFAYQAPWKLVLRGGTGLFYGLSPVGAAGLSGGNVDGFSATTQVVGTINSVTGFSGLDNPFPNGFVQPTGSSLGLMTDVGQGLTSVWRNASQTTKSEQWNLSIQRLIPGSILIETAYAGSRGLNLQLPSNLNFDQLSDEYLQLGSKLVGLVANPFYGHVQVGALAQPQVQLRQLLLPYPQFTGINFVKYPVGQSTYHSFQLRVQRRFSSGLSLFVTYTASKLLTDTDGGENFNGPLVALQDFRSLKQERSLSAVDVPQRFVSSVVYELPLGRRKHWGSSWPALVDGAFGGWQISGIGTYQRGLPVSVTAPNVSQASGSGSGRPNSAGRSAQLSSSRGTDARLAEWFDITAFVLPPNYTYGNVGRLLPDVRADGLRNWDLAVLKNFSLRRERLRLQVRGESFNAFNTVRFGMPAGGLNSATFGTVGGQSNSPRQMQVNLRLNF